MNPFPGFASYLAVFRAYVGRRLYVVFGLSVLAAIADGLAIGLLVPLLATLDVGGEMRGAVPQALIQFVDGLGLQGSTAGILALIGAMFLTKGAIQFISGAYAGYLQAQLMRELKTRLFDGYSRMEYLYYVRGDTGHFLNVLKKQVSAFYKSFASFMTVVRATIMATAYLAMAVLMTWQFGLMAIGAGMLLLLLFRRLNIYVRDLSRLTSRESSRLNKLLVQSLQAFKYLTSTQQMPKVRPAVMTSIERLTDHQLRKQVAHSFTGAVTEPLSVMFIILIVIVQVAILAQPLAPILVAILLFHRGMHSLLGIQSAWQRTLETIGGVEMVRDELDALRVHQESDGKTVIGPLSRGIEFRQVHFAYDAVAGDVLHDISLTIPARTTVAFVGESGAGKSTIVDLLTLLLKPQRGQVLIDGVVARDVDLATWRSQIGYVSQETVVFDDTIAANISLQAGEQAANDPGVRARVYEAAQRAHLAHFIEELRDGYDTVVGDRGVRLSGGQRQRLFIARELFKNPNLLILDEATSALDTESERAIQESIDALRGRMTVVIIAHRLSTIRNVDRLYVLEAGRVIEQGSYEELRERTDSRFGSMVALQAL